MEAHPHLLHQPQPHQRPCCSVDTTVHPSPLLHLRIPHLKHEDEDEMTTDKMDRLIERKRKRRESHNVVERKRRDNINARIDELGALLPPQKQSLKLNRGIILQNSVDHIKFLYHRVAEQQQRIHELEQLLGRNTPNDDLPHHHHPSRNDISHTQDLHQQHQQEKYLQPSYHQQQLPQPATVPYAQSSSSYAANQQQE
ncbi:Myc-type, basic helix-loop-helix domain-containing protein [Absidia repens]|uniref:Myc-type, basic helix-loop-helix domain-containing protein n=1 Tax=Absidia repens TaxID=90262 RepID=A0A1X2IWV7_9FUNG|nr:Myc-type, basic helix-loop-helix domain-containing protein [Absidia repens]